MLKRDLEIELVNKNAELTLVKKELEEKNELMADLDRELGYREGRIKLKDEVTTDLEAQLNIMDKKINTLEKTIVNFSIQKYK